MRDLRVLARYLAPCRRDFAAAVALLLAECCLEMAIPLLMSRAIDGGVAAGDAAFLCRQGVLMALCAGLALAAGFLYARFAARGAYRFGAGLRQAEYEKVQRFAFSNLDRFSSSSLVTRMTTDITVMQNAVNGGLRPMVRGPVMLLLGVGLSFLMNAKLALVFVVSTPILGAVLALIVHKVGPLYGRQQQAMDRLNSRIQEGLTGIRAIKAFVRGEYEEARFQEVSQELSDASRATFQNAVLNLPCFQLVMYTAVAAILWFGGRFIMEGEMLVGELTGFLSYVLQVMNSLMMISNVFLLLTRSLTSARRIGQVLEEEPDLEEAARPVREVPDGSIDFDRVSFQYQAGAEKYALREVDLHIQAGETVGILGGTGSAKSTLVQLIPRLYDATEGTVRVGGRDVRSYSLSALRDAVGIVLQKNVLFSGTVRDNLKWGDPEADDGALWAACRAACADEFLELMPRGLDTDLGQGGVNVSGGQKQRLCIARTLLKNPKILIFDDSTSAVDTATEGKIRQALAQRRDVTKLIIAQRLTSVMEADKIVILEDGRIHAVGTHRELLASDPIYQEIYRSQMREEDAHG